jgi:hypothetical protein
MNIKSISIVFLFLLSVTAAKGAAIDSLQIVVQQGDSCMQ